MEQTNEEVKKPRSKAKALSEIVKKDISDVTKEELSEIYDSKQRVSVVATKKERKKIYESDEIIPLEGYEVVTEESKRKAEFETLMDAAAPGKPKILDGEISGLKVTESKEWILAEVTLKDSEGYFSIFIPSNELFVYDQSLERTPEGKVKIQKNIEKRIGAPIKFIPMAVSEKEMICYASRLRALEIMAKKNYIDEQANGLPLYRKGSKAQGIITRVAAKTMDVSIAGAECTISIEEVSHVHSLNLYEEYELGQLVNVLIEEVTLERIELSSPASKKKVVAVLPKVVASIRKANANPNEVYFDKFDVGTLYSGVITYIVNNNLNGDNGNCFVRLKNKIDCHCPRPNNYKPEVGMKVIVKVTSKYEADFRVNGVIIN